MTPVPAAGDDDGMKERIEKELGKTGFCLKPWPRDANGSPIGADDPVTANMYETGVKADDGKRQWGLLPAGAGRLRDCPSLGGWAEAAPYIMRHNYIAAASALGGSAPEVLEEVVEVFEFGARKYAPDNWLKVPDGERRYRAAALRHLMSMHDGEHLDPESGLSHRAHCIASLLMADGRIEDEDV